LFLILIIKKLKTYLFLSLALSDFLQFLFKFFNSFKHFLEASIRQELSNFVSSQPSKAIYN